MKMTLTAQGCGMGPSIAADARQKILTLEGIQEAQVDVVWEPAWGPQMITPDGRKKVGHGLTMPETCRARSFAGGVPPAWQFYNLCLLFLQSI